MSNLLFNVSLILKSQIWGGIYHLPNYISPLCALLTLVQLSECCIQRAELVSAPAVRSPRCPAGWPQRSAETATSLLLKELWRGADSAALSEESCPSPFSSGI